MLRLEEHMKKKFKPSKDSIFLCVNLIQLRIFLFFLPPSILQIERFCSSTSMQFKLGYAIQHVARWLLLSETFILLYCMIFHINFSFYVRVCTHLHKYIQKKYKNGKELYPARSNLAGLLWNVYNFTKTSNISSQKNVVVHGILCIVYCIQTNEIWKERKFFMIQCSCLSLSSKPYDSFALALSL